MTQPWSAPLAIGALDAVVTVPGSKSLTNRALVLAALADGPSRIRRPLRARDTELMAAGLRALGTSIEPAEDGDWLVTPGPLIGPASVDCGLAGTVMRFLPPLAALATGPVSFDGDPRARERPMGPVLDALRTLGASIDDAGRGGLPFTVHGTGALAGGPVVLDASASSQFLSALLLVAARTTRGVTVRHEGAALPSRPHVDMTTALLREHGVYAAQTGPDEWHVAAGPIQPRLRTIEPDLSNAAPFLAAALVTHGRARVPDLPLTSVQPVAHLADVLERLGGRVEHDTTGLMVSGSGALQGADLDMAPIGELVPTVAALAALADSRTTVRGVGHLRGHETDRLAALTTELRRLGGDAHETPDGLEVTPAALHGGLWHTYGDHRMATAGAVLGLVVPGVEVEDISTTGKTLPDFERLWLAMLGHEVGA